MNDTPQGDENFMRIPVAKDCFRLSIRMNDTP